MSRIVILEDHRDYVVGLGQRLKTKLPGEEQRVFWAKYLSEYGVKLEPMDVVAAAIRVVETDRTLFLVDLAPERHKLIPDTAYGLTVIREIATALRKHDITDFLKNTNYAVIIMTAHDVSKAEVLKCWGAQYEDIAVKRISEPEDVDWFLNERITKAILPVINKSSAGDCIDYAAVRWCTMDG